MSTPVQNTEIQQHDSAPQGQNVEDIRQLEASDAMAAREAASRVSVALAMLGELRAEYLRAEILCVQQLDAARTEYETITRTFARKYTRDGRYNFNAELGAFVTARAEDKR